MAEKVTIGNCELWHGDCREVLPLLAKHDAVVCSPPYNTLNPSASPSGLHAERKTGKNAWMDKQGGYFDQMDEIEYQQQQRDFLNLCLSVAPVVWINHKTRYRDGFGIHPLQFYRAPLFAEVVWDRGGSMALNCGRYAPSHEYWFGFGKPDKWNNENNKMLSVWRIPPGIEKDGDNDHPCPYPIRLVSPIISSCVFDRGCVDPYMGSGTTGVACVQLGKTFTGIERERKYFDIACRRIEQAYAQPRLFDDAKVGAGDTAAQGDMLLPANAELTGAAKRLPVE